MYLVEYLFSAKYVLLLKCSSKCDIVLHANAFIRRGINWSELVQWTSKPCCYNYEIQIYGNLLLLPMLVKHTTQFNSIQ